MNGSGRLSEYRPPSWQDAYDKPLPDAAKRTRENVANAPWAVDVERIGGALTYPSAIFTNPAMQGAPVALAPPAPAPKAAPEHQPLVASPHAERGITAAPLRASSLPVGSRTDLTRAFTCGAGYKLYPELKMQEDGKEAVLYYTAVNVKEGRAEFIVGPDSLATFTSNPKDYADAALRFFAQGMPNEVAAESGKVVDAAMRDGFGAAFRQLGKAWMTAIKDPEWVVQNGTQVAAGLVGAAAAQRVARGAEVKQLATLHAERLAATAVREEPAITSALKASSETAGGQVAGIESRLKSQDSLARKLETRATPRVEMRGQAAGAAVEAEAERVNDAVRYTVCASPANYAGVCRSTVAELEARGFKAMTQPRWNAWGSDGYKGLNMTFRSPTGQLFEVQFHTPESFAVKTELHGLYEEWRKPSTPPARRAELSRVMNERYGAVAIPEGASSL